MDGAHESPSEAAGRWFARLRAPDCTPQDRAEFEAWRASDPKHAAAYAAAERLNDALAKLAMADGRLKAMVDQAASAGATLPDDSEEPPTGEPRRLTISATPKRPRSGRGFTRAAIILAAAGSALAVLSVSRSEPGSPANGPADTASAQRPLQFEIARGPDVEQ
jgi:ferric-dicitrate binding protein FerR (iron transport regulator)